MSPPTSPYFLSFFLFSFSSTPEIPAKEDIIQTVYREESTQSLTSLTSEKSDSLDAQLPSALASNSSASLSSDTPVSMQSQEALPIVPKRTLSSSLSSSELVKKTPMLGTVDVEDILERDPELLSLVRSKEMPPQPKPTPKMAFGFKKVGDRKKFVEAMELQCLEHRTKIRKEIESQYEDLPAEEGTTVEGGEDGGDEEEVEGGGEEEGENPELDLEVEDDGDKEDNDEDQEEKSDEEDDTSESEDDKITSPPAMQVVLPPSQDLVPTQITDEDGNPVPPQPPTLGPKELEAASAAALLAATLAARTEEPKEKNAFVEAEAEESDVEQGFGESGDEIEEQETLKDLKMLAPDDEEIGGIDVDHQQLFQLAFSLYFLLLLLFFTGPDSKLLFQTDNRTRRWTERRSRQCKNDSLRGARGPVLMSMMTCLSSGRGGGSRRMKMRPASSTKTMPAALPWISATPATPKPP